MAANLSAQEALEHVLESSTCGEADFTDMEDLQSSNTGNSAKIEIQMLA